MTLSTKSIKNQLRTVGRFPKFLVLLGVSSLVLPLFSYAASAATVQPSARLSQGVQVLNGARNGHAMNYLNVPFTTFTSKIGPDGALLTSTHYSAKLRVSQPGTTVAPTITLNVAPTTTAAPITSTTVAPTITPTVAPTTTATTVAPTVAPTITPTVAPTVAPTTVAPTTSTTVVTSSTTSTTVAPTTTTTAAPPSSVTSGGLITDGPSRSECLEPNFTDTGLASLQAAVTSFDAVTHSAVTCVLAYTNGAQTWAQWDSPWVAQSIYGYSSWVAEAPQSRQLVLGVDLIPTSLADISNPLGWEQSCAAGNFDSYATALGTNLVAAGLQNSVLRLGEEMNGPWEKDFIGDTTQEQNLWASCFANEVTALRQATGEHFIIDWNPNACSENIPYANFYPGNAYVDILGLDFYDQSCMTPATPVTWTQLANEPAGLTSFETFAAAQGKAMSFPEWGLVSNSGGDDPGYINGIASTVASGNFAFQAYFDAGNDGIPLLGPTTPLATAAFTKQFG